MKREFSTIPFNDVLVAHPYAEDFLLSIGMHNLDRSRTLQHFVDSLEDDQLEDLGLDKLQVLDQFEHFIGKMRELSNAPSKQVDSITIIGGHNKTGDKEQVRFTLKPGEVICVVGPTGGGEEQTSRGH